MSAEVRRNDSLHQLRSKEKRSGILDWANAISYGPFSHAGAAAIGFVAGSLAFLIGDAIWSPHPGALRELPVLLLCAGGGSALLPAAAVAANYVIGRQIRTQRQLANTPAPSDREFLQNMHFRDGCTG